MEQLTEKNTLLEKDLKDHRKFIEELTVLYEAADKEKTALAAEKVNYEMWYNTSQVNLDELSRLAEDISDEKNRLENENSEFKVKYDEL